MNTEQKPYPIERVLTDADHLAQVAEQLMQALNKLADAEAKAELEETEENTEAVEQCQSEVADFFTGVRLATHEYLKRARRYRESVAPAIKDSLTADRLAEPIAWVRFCSDGCYEGPLMNSSPAMDGARRTSGAWTPLFAAQLVARDLLMALAEEVRETCWQVGSGDATIRELDLAAIVDRYAAQLPAMATHIQELEAQLNAAILARREAQQVAQDAIEARNGAGVEIRRPLLKRIAELEAQQAAVAVPAGYRFIPIEPTPEMIHAGAEGDSQFYEHAGFVYRAMLAAAPQAAQPAQLPPYNSFSDDGGESWRDHPADCDFVDGMKLGEEFELLGGWKAKHLTFRVTKVPDDENDDYEVEEVTTPAAAQKGGAA